jgi:threonine dehydrogenase-like Zn-dependent dehydrogenase
MSEISSDAILLSKDLKLKVGTVVVPDPALGFARIKLEWAGVCGSDLHVLRTGDWVTYWPAVLGHEAVGVIESCPGDEVAVGTRVVIDSRVGCDACEGCQHSPMRCESLKWVGEASPGGFQRYGVFPAQSLHVFPGSLDPSVAVLAEPLAVVLHAVNLIGDVPENALILGYGPIGALVHSELVRRQPTIRVTVREPNPGRAQLARAAGATIGTQEFGGWSLVIDAAGFPGSLSAAMESASVDATVLLVAIGHAGEEIQPQVLVEKGLRVIGSHGFTDELPTAIGLISATPSSYRWLITEAMELADAPERLNLMLLAPAVGKAVIRL